MNIMLVSVMERTVLLEQYRANQPNDGSLILFRVGSPDSKPLWELSPDAFVNLVARPAARRRSRACSISASPH
jgi:hypothetical protein